MNEADKFTGPQERTRQSNSLVHKRERGRQTHRSTRGNEADKLTGPQEGTKHTKLNGAISCDGFSPESLASKALGIGDDSLRAVLRVTETYLHESIRSPFKG